MKRIIAIVLLIALSLNCTYTLEHYNKYTGSEPVIISDRVGEIIDAREREQFGLLKGIEDFESAQYYELKEGGYRIEIIAGGKLYEAVNRDSQGVEILRDYIERFADIPGSEIVFEDTWGIIDYDTLGQPITADEKKYFENHYRSPATAYATCVGCVASVFNLYVSLVIIGGLEIGIVLNTGTTFKRPLIGLVSFIALNILMIANVSKIGKNQSLEIIKEARKPRVIEGE